MQQLIAKVMTKENQILSALFLKDRLVLVLYKFGITQRHQVEV